MATGDFGYTEREQQLERLVITYRDALGEQNQPSEITAGLSSRRLAPTDLWVEGETQFLELERCLTLIEKHAPRSMQHFRACYGLHPFELHTGRRTLKRKGPDWIGMQTNERVVGSPIPDGWNRKGKAVTVEIDVAVETWPAWVRRRKVHGVMGLLAGEYRRGEKRREVFVPPFNRREREAA